MSHLIAIPDDIYAKLATIAACQGQTPEELLFNYVSDLTDRDAAILEEAEESAVYDPADDPLAEFLGTGELTSPDAIRRHDEAIGAEALDTHES